MYHFVCVSDLPPCMPAHGVPHACGGHFQDPLELQLQKVIATMWVWELNPGLPQERLLLLITLASLQSLYRKFLSPIKLIYDSPGMLIAELIFKAG